MLDSPEPQAPTRQIIADLLNTITDPCSVRAGVPAGLVDMGLVHAISVVGQSSGAAVAVTIGTTDPMCMMAAVFLAEARSKLSALPGVVAVTVSLERRVVWSPERFSDAYVARLTQARGVPDPPLAEPRASG